MKGSTGGGKGRHHHLRPPPKVLKWPHGFFVEEVVWGGRSFDQTVMTAVGLENKKKRLY